jgi:hypothetical protein
MGKIHVISDNTSQDKVFKLGRKELLVAVAYTDGCYSEFNEYDFDGEKAKIVESLVLNPKAKRYDMDRWIRYRYLRLFRLPFSVTYKWKGTDETFKVKPILWLRLGKVNDEY